MSIYINMIKNQKLSAEEVCRKFKKHSNPNHSLRKNNKSNFSITPNKVFYSAAHGKLVLQMLWQNEG